MRDGLAEPLGLPRVAHICLTLANVGVMPCACAGDSQSTVAFLPFFSLCLCASVVSFLRAFRVLRGEHLQILCASYAT